MHFYRRTALSAALLGIAAIIGASVPGGAQQLTSLKIATTPTEPPDRPVKRINVDSKKIVPADSVK